MLRVLPRDATFWCATTSFPPRSHPPLAPVCSFSLMIKLWHRRRAVRKRRAAPTRACEPRAGMFNVCSKYRTLLGGGLTPCSDFWPKDRDIILQPFSVLFFIVVYLTAVFGFVFHRQKRGRDRARQPQTLRRRRSAETARAPLPRGSPGTPLVRGDLSPSLGAHTYRGFWEHCLHEKLEPAAVAPNQDFWENAADARVSWRQRSKKPLCAPQS